MKICWNNLEKLRYNPSKDVWYNKHWEKYIYMDSCKACDEPYLTKERSVGEFCDKSCANRKENHYNWKHGYSNSSNPTYNSWQSMIQRCINPNTPNYNRYGGRGIMVCERWTVFENFLGDMGERPEGKTLDRINNDGHYELDNCKWSTYEEQGQNRIDNVLTKIQVEEIKELIEKNDLTLQQIGDMYGVNHSRISAIKNKREWRNI